jgi:hypothetical protein
LQHPLAVVDPHHHARAIVEPVMVVGAHHEHAMHADDVGCLERVAQRGAKLRRSRLGLLGRFGNGLGQQLIGVPQVAAERRARAELRSYFVTYSAAAFFTAFESGSCSYTSIGPIGSNVPLPSLPTTRRKSGLPTPCV